MKPEDLIVLKGVIALQKDWNLKSQNNMVSPHSNQVAKFNKINKHDEFPNP